MAIIPRLAGNALTRLVGLEIELDASGAQYHSPGIVSGWDDKPDGSVHNGREYVLEPALPFGTVMDKVKSFSDAATAANTFIGKRGGYHVHVQAHDITFQEAFNLCRIYTHFQTIINNILAPSRTNNTFARPYPEDLTLESLADLYCLTHTHVDSRAEAKGSRRYSVVNLAMMRCANPFHRSIEFRQGSPSKRVENIYGWCALCVALVEISKMQTLVDDTLTKPKTSMSFITMLRKFERVSGSTDLAAWYKWRRDYMNQDATPELKNKCLEAIGTSRHGIFFLSKALNVPNNVAAKLCTSLVTEGVLVQDGLQYRRAARVEPDELAMLESNMARAPLVYSAPG